MTTSSSLQIFENLHELLHMFRTRTRSHLEASHPELTLNEARVLLHTARHPGITQKDVIERSHTDKAQMTRILSSLETQGWITRTPSTADKRVRHLHLSPAGKQLVTQLQAVQQQVADELLGDWPEALRMQLLHTLQSAAHGTRPSE